MIENLSTLPIEEKIQLVEDLWDSIAQGNFDLPLSQAQKDELDIRLSAYKIDANKGRDAKLVFADIRKNL